MKERIFYEANVADIDDVHGPGSLVIAEALPDAGYEVVGDTATGLPIWWQAAPVEEIAEAGFALRALVGTKSINIVEAKPVSHQDGLALLFAEHLFEHRGRNGRTTLPPLVAANTPSPPADCVRIPHLITYASKASVSDVSVWEVLPTSEAESWLNGTLPDQHLAESYLPQLLNLKRRIRVEGLDNTDINPKLANQLSSGRYLSILFFYQHFALFQSMFDQSSD